VGFRALAVNTGSRNTAVGGGDNTTYNGALSANTTGTDNAAFGIGALANNTTGLTNTASGVAAMYNNTTAGGNTAVGFQAGYLNTTAENNAYFGREAGRSANAIRTTCIGYHAGYNVTGAGNTMIGSSSGQGASTGCTGTRNVAIGSWFDGSQEGPLASFTSGSDNFAVGYGSLKVLTTGSANIAIGPNAGRSAITAANNIIIGPGADIPASNNNNSIVMGINAAGKGTDTGFITPNGGGVYQGNNSSTWSTTSDQRLKKNIVDNNTVLEIINAIQVRNFEYRLPEEVDTELSPRDAIKKSGVQLGVIAQELQQVLPECVKTESTGVMSVDTDNLIWYAINAIKEQQALIVSLKARLDAANL
jgi:hypothetical protein